jgi:hypothetical protein
MDSDIINIITCNIINPYNSKIRVHFTNRAIKLLVETFTNTPIKEIDFICFCFKLANYSECLLNEEDINNNRNIVNHKYINIIRTGSDNNYDDNVFLIKNKNKNKDNKTYITLSNIYNFIINLKKNNIDNYIIFHCWNNFISCIKQFNTIRDNKYCEVYNLQLNIINNPVPDLQDYIKCLNK